MKFGFQDKDKGSVIVRQRGRAETGGPNSEHSECGDAGITLEQTGRQELNWSMAGARQKQGWSKAEAGLESGKSMEQSRGPRSTHTSHDLGQVPKEEGGIYCSLFRESWFL